MATTSTLSILARRELRRFSPILPLLLLVPALLLALFAWRFPNAERILNLAVVLFFLGPLSALVTHWLPKAGALASLLGLSGLIFGISLCFEMPILLAALVLPIMLCAMAAGVAVAGGLALLHTIAVGLLTLGWLPVTPLGIGAATTVLIILWAAVTIVWAIYRSVYELAEWSWQHYAQAQEMLERSRDRQVELKEVLEALGHANRESALMNERLATLRLAAENAQKAKAAFVSGVSHEFRTPLNIIIGLAELLMDTPAVFGETLGQRTQAAIAILHHNCEHLASMIDDVLDLSQVEAGRLSVYREGTDLGALIRTSLTVVAPLLERKGLDLTLDAPDTLPEVYCDARRIRQVILNLVSNAARFTDHGGIRVAVAIENSHVVVCVEDTGPGIAPEDLDRLFQPFQQAIKMRREGVDGGHGLGLAISKQFVELHSGKMWVESVVGQGSRFFFQLPVSPPSEPTAPPERWIREGWVTRTKRAALPQARLAERMILCDNTGEIRPLLARHADHTEFVAVQTPDEAVRRLQEMPAQAVLVNASSPDELMTTVNALSRLIPDVPIIGHSLPSKSGHARRAGALGYLLKPIRRSDLEQLFAQIDGPLERVLIVDDEEDTLWFLEQMVSVCRPDVAIGTAHSGEEALQRMRSWRPQLVLLDIIMPDMDGWQILEARAADSALADIPVAVISAQDPYETPSTSEADGVEHIASPTVVAAMGEGISIDKLLRCAEALSTLLLDPD
jgi:signal transduction histidine kinase/CheY-like chemotaxis protein